MTGSDRAVAELVRHAADAEAACVPDGANLWDRTQRRLRRRRRTRITGVVSAICALALLGSAAVSRLWTPTPEGVVFETSHAPPGWTDVAVGRAVISVPPDWQVVDERDAPHGHCQDLPPRTLFVRSSPGYEYWSRCDQLPLHQVLQVAALREQPDGVEPGDVGETVRLGSVAAWRITHPRSPDLVDSSAPLPTMTSWLAPSVSLWAAVPSTLDAAEVLATVRPRGSPDADAAVLLTEHRDGTGGSITYAGIDASGRRHKWHHEEEANHDVDVRMSYVRNDWPGLNGERFAVLDVVDPGGVRLVAGRPGRSATVWEEPAVSTDLTFGSHPQVTWSPDGTAAAWYAPRAEPVMGFARWDSVDAIADGEPPAQTQTVTVAHGPVQADPPTLAWTAVEDQGWILSMFRGIPAPYDPSVPETGQDYRRWELAFGPGPDGSLKLPDPVRFVDLPIRQD